MLEKLKGQTNSLFILLSIFIAAALLIFTQSYFFGAHISPDSTGYLRAAEALRNGYGFRINALAGNTQSYFAVWPIGYPAMIAFIALITNTEIYLASKILSVIILLIIVMLFYLRFKNNAWMYALVLCNYGFLQIFYYTWSEQPFILGLIWLSFALADILKSEKAKYPHYISITLASLFLFFSRYIGAFSLGVLGLTALYEAYTGISRHNRARLKKAVLLGICTGVSLTIMALYLFNNYKNNGYATGGERLPAENHLRLFIGLCEAQLAELQNVFYLFFKISRRTACILYALGAVICFHIIYLKRRSFYKNIPVNVLSFMALGMLYWVSIVSMRFLSAFDPFTFRLLFPASALLFLGVISAVCHRYSQRIEKALNSVYGLLFAAFLLVSLGLYAAPPFVNKYIHKTARSYKQIRTEILRELSLIPPGSTVISLGWQDKRFSNFMRPDLLSMSVYELPLTKLYETRLASFFEQTKSGVYLFADWTHLSDEQKDALNSIIAQYGERPAQISETLTRIR
jgi:hypothetical protein